MPFSRSMTFTLLGVAMGAGIGLALPHVLTPNVSTALFGGISTPLLLEPNDNILALEASPETTAQPSTNPRRPGNRGQIGLFQQLKLSPSQKQKLIEVRKQYQGQLRDRQRATQQAQRELRSLLVGSASADTVRSKFTEFQQLQQSAATLRFQSLLAMREVLTSPQRQQLAELMMRQKQNPRLGRKGLMEKP
jgi:periplasmic protein CpxP/Spy